MKIFKKILCTFLIVVMCLTAAPLDGFVGIKWFGSKASALDYTEGYYTYSVNEQNEALIIGVDDNISGDIIVPKTLGGYKVTGIGDYAFSGKQNIVSVVIPGSINYIYSWAFSNCDGLKDVIICNGVEYIGDAAFIDCNNLLNVTIPESMIKIYNMAFYDSPSIEKVNYTGTIEQWDEIEICSFNKKLLNAEIFYGYTNEFDKLYGNIIYKTGDIIQFGSYPQSEVKDETLIAELNALAPEWDEWTSYGYYSGNGNIGSMVQGDWMRYTDITYNENKYRGVKFTQYRPYATYSSAPSSNTAYSNTYQDDNSYYTNILYWFKFEPIDWRVLDPSSGLIMCENIIDSQPFSNTVYYNDDMSIAFNDFFYENYASNYETSSIRKWLNEDFYNTAFIEKEKNAIKKTTLNNDSYETSKGYIGWEKFDSKETQDKMFLLSFNEARSCDFNFNSEQIEDKARQAQGSDYAQCQGLYVCISYDSYIGNSVWSLRSSVNGSKRCCFVTVDGYSDSHYFVYQTELGVRPALCLNQLSDIGQSKKLELNHENLTTSNNICPNISVKTYPDGVTKDDIIWTSSNERVAYIDGSTINPIQYGKTLITASTKDGKYSASCELTVQSSFVITSTNSSLSSIKAGKEAEYSIMLLDSEGNKLPVENVTLSNQNSKYLKIVNHERTETEIKLTVKGLKAGTAVLEFGNDEPLAYNKFAFDIYPATVTYRADQVPVRDKELKTNFSRSGIFIENFRYYAVGEPAEYYKALMSVYNKNGCVGIVASYTQDGQLYDIAEVKKHQVMPTDYFEFLTVLGKGAVDIALLNTYNYRYSVESTKTEIEIEVPINGYITVSNDIKSSPINFVYGIISVAVETAFQLAEDLTSIDKDKKYTVVKKLTKEVTDYFSENTDHFDKLVKELSKDVIKNTSEMNIVSMGNYSLDVVSAIFESMNKKFDDVLNSALNEVLKDSAHTFIKMSMMKDFIDNKAIDKVTGGYIKAGEIMFSAAEHFNIVAEIIDLIHSADSGETTVTFGKCNEDGFICKDTIKVNLKEEQEVLDAIYLQHYQIYIDKNQLTLRPEIKDLNLKENSVVEVHEITIMRDGVPYEIKQEVSVEIDIPDGWATFNFKIYRVEPDGKLTDMFARVANGKAYFTTDHFSEYIFVGELEENHIHTYTSSTVNSTCTENGYIKYTCVCNYSYTEKIPATGHSFAEGKSKCSNCDYNKVDSCGCKCHKSGIAKIIFKIVLIFQKIFKKNKECACGIYHY